MSKKRESHTQWSSWLLFVLAATGSAIGLGNIWKFPYIAGQNGGSAFVLVYLACVIGMGIPMLMAETMIGRQGRLNPLDGMAVVAKESGASLHWRWLGGLGIGLGFLILSYYSVIAGWTIAYIVKMAAGVFLDKDAQAIGKVFAELVANPWRLIFWHSVFMTATMGIVARGVQGGLEKAVEWLTPALFIILFILVGYAVSAGDFQRGLRFLFYPDFSRLTGASVLTAMGHAFFSLSIGMGAMMIYGSYLPENVSIAKTSFIIAAADTSVALLAGLAIFPLVFANQLEPATGPGLIFQTLPLAFSQMPLGALFGTLFFVLLAFAALSSSISLLEPAVAWLVEDHDFSRIKACLACGFVCWFVGLGTVFSFNLWRHWTLFDKNFFDLLDFFTSNLMLPVSGILLVIFASWIMKPEVSRCELATDPNFFKFWWFLSRYVAPAAVGMILLNGIGVL
ncbi:MAG: transporter [Methylothermaceae bacteria B42]|nr:MAG: transporter [Methylothermaceae bacteria B42]HHJ39719.1 sodium-dependent transporter [Methylothermaceae bacterium]